MKNFECEKGLQGVYLVIAIVASLAGLAFCVWGIIFHKPWVAGFDPPFLMVAPTLFGVAVGYLVKGVVRLCG